MHKVENNFSNLIEPTSIKCEIEAEELQNMADGLSSMAWIVPASADSFWFNKAWYDYTGLHPDDMKNWAWQDSFLHEDITRVTSTFFKAVADQTPWEELFRVHGKDGSCRWFLSRTLSIPNARGEVSNWLILMRDVHDYITLLESKLLLSKGIMRK